MSNFFDVTEEDKNKLLDGLLDSPDTHLRASIVALLYLLVEKKIITEDEFSQAVKEVKQEFKEAWKKDKSLDTAVTLNKIFGGKTTKT